MNLSVFFKSSAFLHLLCLATGGNGFREIHVQLDLQTNCLYNLSLSFNLILHKLRPNWSRCFLCRRTHTMSLQAKYTLHVNLQEVTPLQHMTNKINISKTTSNHEKCSRYLCDCRLKELLDHLWSVYDDDKRTSRDLCWCFHVDINKIFVGRLRLGFCLKGLFV